MSDPLISVVLTTYNEMPYKLPIAVYSLLDQTFQDFELLIYHDGGEDKSYKDTSIFIEKLQDERFDHKAITFTCTREKRGAWGYPTRQDSLAQIKGKFVVFTNGDNYHMPVYLEYFAGEIQKYPEVALIHADMVHNYGNGGRPYTFFPTSPGVGAIDLAAYCSRADLVKELGFGTWAGADGELAAKLATKGRVVHIDAVTVCHN
jgi:glycosyltransferase involved in cell wall biosynthesis